MIQSSAMVACFCFEPRIIHELPAEASKEKSSKIEIYMVMMFRVIAPSEGV